MYRSNHAEHGLRAAKFLISAATARQPISIHHSADPPKSFTAQIGASPSSAECKGKDGALGDIDWKKEQVFFSNISY